ncbi:unnamed protein product [Prunus armeniaca]|uniref:Uncharacterized protein n=1 Tax=Prunus armeniaca TaxID=36596 RepID=A0A6J5WN50_PRUAR|nr:unnamed protein product [Prunus armeniaca]
MSPTNVYQLLSPTVVYQLLSPTVVYQLLYNESGRGAKRSSMINPTGWALNMRAVTSGTFAGYIYTKTDPRITVPRLELAVLPSSPVLFSSLESLKEGKPLPLHRSPLSLSSFLSSAANVSFAQKTQFHHLFLTVRTEAVLGLQLVAMGVAVKNPSATASFGVPKTSPWRGSVGGGTGLMIECSSRPQKKATAHHRKTRPRKTQPWDVKTQAHCVHSSASSPCRLDIGLFCR